MSDKQDLLTCLKKLEENGPQDTEEGICENVDILWYRDESLGCSKAYYIIPDVAEGWPHHSGDEDYPIPSNDPELSAENFFDSGLEKWEGEQGELRKDLVRYMINKLEEELGEQS